MHLTQGSQNKIGAEQQAFVDDVGSLQFVNKNKGGVEESTSRSLLMVSTKHVWQLCRRDGLPLVVELLPVTRSDDFKTRVAFGEAG